MLKNFKYVFLLIQKYKLQGNWRKKIEFIKDFELIEHKGWGQNKKFKKKETFFAKSRI